MAQASRDRRAKRGSSTTTRGRAISANAAIGMAATDGVSGVELTRLGSDVARSAWVSDGDAVSLRIAVTATLTRSAGVQGAGGKALGSVQAGGAWCAATGTTRLRRER